MSEDKEEPEKEEKKEEDDSFVEGFAEGFVETLIHPFRWGRRFLTGRDEQVRLVFL